MENNPPLIYVAGPYRAPDSWQVEQNVRRAERWGWEIARHGYVPVIPHTMYRYFDRTLTDEFWLRATQQLLLMCDALVLIPGWGQSEGCGQELALAKQRGLRVWREQETGCPPRYPEDMGRMLEWLASWFPYSGEANG